MGMIKKLIASGIAAKVIQEARKPENKAKIKKAVADFQAKTGIHLPHLVRPLLELGVVRDTSLEGDRIELGAPGRLAARARIPALAMRDHFGGPLECAALAHPGDVPTVPAQPELEVLVGVEPLGVDAELSHGYAPGRICWMLMTTNSAGFTGAKPTMMLTIPRSMSS